MNYPKVSIIILNWNGWGDTIECLESLYQITYPNSEAVSVNALPKREAKGCYDVIVVDNGSEDDSIERMKEYCEGKLEVQSKFFKYSSENKPIKILEYTREEAEAGGGNEKEIADVPSNRKLIPIKNEKNYGFAEGNNIGMRYALKALNPDYVLLLNNDTVVDRAFLGELVKVAESDERIGFVGPKIYYYDESDRIFSIGGKIDAWSGRTPFIGWGTIDRGQYEEISRVDYVSGCALLVKRDLIEKIGLLNASYFSYYEDTEWCVKARQKGYKVICAPKARIWHKIAATSRKSELYTYYMTRNRFLFMRANSTMSKFLSSSVFFFMTYLPVITIRNMYRGDISSIKAFYKAIYDGLAPRR